MCWDLIPIQKYQKPNGFINKKMDMKWFPYPHPGELSGTSNNATATIGPPSFADAKFSLKEAVKSMRIKLTN